jgi:hypothetical protein
MAFPTMVVECPFPRQRTGQLMFEQCEQIGAERNYEPQRFAN